MDKVKDPALLMKLQEEACQKIGELKPLATGKTITVDGVEIEISPAMLALVRSKQVTLYAVDKDVPVIKVNDSNKTTARSKSGAPAVRANNGEAFKSEQDYKVVLTYVAHGGEVKTARFIQFWISNGGQRQFDEARFPDYPREATDINNQIVAHLQDATLQRGVLHEPQIVGRFNEIVDPWAFVQPKAWEKANLIAVFARWNGPFAALEARARKIEV